MEELREVQEEELRDVQEEELRDVQEEELREVQEEVPMEVRKKGSSRQYPPFSLVGFVQRVLRKCHWRVGIVSLVLLGPLGELRCRNLIVVLRLRWRMSVVYP